MPDAMLPPSEVKKAAEEILSKPDLFDSEFGYIEQGEPYFLRRLACAWDLTRSRVMPPIITLIVTAIIGILSGITWNSVWSGIASGLITFIVGLIFIYFFNFTFSAPKKMDETLRENLRAAKKQLLEERYKAIRALALIEKNYEKLFRKYQTQEVTFEVSTKIWESTVCLTDPGDTEDWRDATAFLLEAHLYIRYYNEDSEAVRIYGLRFSIVNDVTGKEYDLDSHLIPPVFKAPDSQEAYFHYFQGFMVAANDLTGYYFHQFNLNVPTECALSVDRNTFLRVTLDAGKQNPYSVDLAVLWNPARPAHRAVSIRRPSPE